MECLGWMDQCTIHPPDARYYSVVDEQNLN
jgi:hypothetical protein